VTLEERIAEMEAALQEIRDKQQETLATLRSNGVVFTDLGTDPTNWQHVAFTIYADLCETESIARAALSLREQAPQSGQFSLYEIL